MKPEFSRPLSIEGMSLDKTRHETIEATKEECTALATRLGLQVLSNLTAKLNIRRIAGGKSVRVNGAFKAELVQTCVVSLQDVPGYIEGEFKTFFSEEMPDARDISFSVDDSGDITEMIENGKIDLGEVVTQYLALEIDPYPRAPGVQFAAQMEANGDTKRPNPFQVLETLKGGAGK